MHTLLSHNHLDPGQFANDSLAFLRGFRGHSNALMQEFATNSERGLKGSDAAGTTDQAHSLIKVRTHSHHSLPPCLLGLGSCLNYYVMLLTVNC